MAGARTDADCVLCLSDECLQCALWLCTVLAPCIRACLWPGGGGGEGAAACLQEVLDGASSMCVCVRELEHACGHLGRMPVSQQMAP